MLISPWQRPFKDNSMKNQKTSPLRCDCCAWQFRHMPQVAHKASVAHGGPVDQTCPGACIPRSIVFRPSSRTHPSCLRVAACTPCQSGHRFVSAQQPRNQNSNEGVGAQTHVNPTGNTRNARQAGGSTIVGRRTRGVLLLTLMSRTVGMKRVLVCSMTA